MTRIFLSLHAVGESDFGARLFELPQDLSHHVRDVLRLAVGKQLIVVDPESRHEYLAIIAVAVSDKNVQVQLLRLLETKVTAPLIRTLACGLPKGTHPDEICEKVSQLGIEQIVFWSADRSIVKPKQGSIKIERWQRICEASARQSQQNSIPKVFFFESSPAFFSWLAKDCIEAGDLLAICSLSSKAVPIAQIVQPQGRVHMIIGPEGDFSEAELGKLEELRGMHVSLGPLVLRVETAAIVSVAMGLGVWGWGDATLSNISP